MRINVLSVDNFKSVLNCVINFLSNDDESDFVVHINLKAVFARYNWLIKLIITSEINKDAIESLPTSSINTDCCDELIGT